MSASMRPTRPPCFCRASARLAATVDLPTPPLPLATAIRCLTPGREIFWGAPPGGCMVVSSVRLAQDALRALTQRPEVFEGKDAAVVAVAPGDLVGVAADRLHPQRPERHQLARLEDVERVGRLL